MSTALKEKTTGGKYERVDSLKRRRFTDRIARWVITFGGITIILSIIAILFFIALEVYPLWKEPTAKLVAQFNLNTNTNLNPPSRADLSSLALGVEEYRKVGFFSNRDGKVEFFSPESGNLIKSVTIESLNGAKITSFNASLDSDQLILGTSNGMLISINIDFKVSFTDGKRIITPYVLPREAIRVDPQGNPLILSTFKEDEGEFASAAKTSDGRLLFLAEKEKRGLFAQAGEKEEFLVDLSSRIEGEVTALALDHFLENLYVGTNLGKIYNWNLIDKSNPLLIDTLDVTDGSAAAITALGFLIGERSLLVGDSSGEVSVWFQVEDKTSPVRRRLKKIHILKPHTAAVTTVAGSPRNRGFLSADEKGNILLHHATSEQTSLKLSTEGRPIKALTFAPKADGALAVDESGRLYHWEINNPHPETNLKTLFGKVWYEGYKKPEYVWQSTGGTDDFESKLSLTPLAYGTLKGTFYALFFAIPLAILGAIYTAQFSHPSIRNTVKPVIEIMAALPSVVLGFLAGLWMAPLIDKIVPAVLVMPLVLTAMVLASVFLWRSFPQRIRGRFREGTEALLLIPILILGIQICLWLNHPVENALFGGDIKGWLYENLGLRYDQRNALVVGFAMGFAVIPIIFTISEDAISNVPRHLVSGSLALGATRWQTMLKVVLPTASPGIFSAVMIGFGRAVGETMIVLMATGNTPVMDWSIFNGFRALSANIAVEIPEAPYGGTLYRVLFLAALLLFIVTFIINTGAEIVRLRLRKKYAQL